MKQRTDLHLARNAFHITGVTLILILYNTLPWKTGLYLLIAFSLIFLLAEILRFQWTPFNAFLTRVGKKLMRPEELNHYCGVTYMVWGALILVGFFPPAIVILSLLFLGIGDPTSSIMGTLYGKKKLLRNKSLQGTLAGFFVCTIVSAIFFYTNHLFPEHWILASLIAGAIGAISELITIGKIDDNLTFPVLSASGLVILFYFFNAFS